MDFLLTTFTDQMKSAGLTAADVFQIFVTNPATAYAFAEAHRGGGFQPPCPSIV
jgi:hypothetical protein